MSEEENNFTVDNFLKKIQEGDNTILIVGIIALIIPLVALFFLTGGSKSSKGLNNQKIRSMTQRKNVFNFGVKKDNNSKSSSRSNMPSSSSNWFGSRTPEQQVRDEIQSAYKAVERSMAEVRAPSHFDPVTKQNYEAEHNYNLCMAYGAIQHGKYDEAEEYLIKALNDSKDNPFLQAYAYSALCSVYESTGDKVKLEKAIRSYIDAVGNMPNGYGGDLKRSVRDMYQCLMTLGEYADPAKVSEALSDSSLSHSGQIPSNVNIKEVYKSFPVKYD